jgi:hypothetical protein
MNFLRERIAPVALDALRTVGARDGWLVETSEVVRVGFGGAVASVELPGGL